MNTFKYCNNSSSASDVIWPDTDTATEGKSSTARFVFLEGVVVVVVLAQVGVKTNLDMFFSNHSNAVKIYRFFFYFFLLQGHRDPSVVRTHPKLGSLFIVTSSKIKYPAKYISFI